MIIGFGPILIYSTCVPDFAVDKDRNKITRNSREEISETDKFLNCVEFDLPDDKWFAYDNGIIVRFPKDKEWDWRTKRAQEIVYNVSTYPNKYKSSNDRLIALESSAHLCGFSLQELISRLETAKRDGEDLVDVFKRVKNETKFGQ